MERRHLISSLKRIIPWPAKIIAKIIFSRLPVGYRIWQSIGLFRHGKMDSALYALNVFKSHINKAKLQKNDISGKVILEIGPGDSIATIIIAYSLGARAILVDAGRFVSEDISSYQQLCKLLQNEGLTTPDLSNITNVDEIIDLCNGEYKVNGIEAWHEIADESIDFVFSQAVLEHVRLHQFLDIQRHCYRVMADDAIASHRVDLKDHLGGKLNNLRFSEKRWESNLFTSSGFYTNRIRMTTMIDIFEQAGFNSKIIDSQNWSSLPTPKSKMNPSFADFSVQELSIKEFDVLLTKKI